MSTLTAKSIATPATKPTAAPTAFPAPGTTEPIAVPAAVEAQHISVIIKAYVVTVDRAQAVV